LTKNISAGGLVFISDEFLAFGTVIEINIDLPQSQETIQCLGRVVRIKELDKNRYDIAVCFLDMTGSQRSKLDKYVKEREL
jgi:c-di-GMP-binding flagellar brake protein YcgR